MNTDNNRTAPATPESYEISVGSGLYVSDRHGDIRVIDVDVIMSDGSRKHFNFGKNITGETIFDPLEFDMNQTFYRDLMKAIDNE